MSGRKQRQTLAAGSSRRRARPIKPGRRINDWRWDTTTSTGSNEEPQQRRGAAGLFASDTDVPILKPSRGRIEPVSRELRLQWP